MTQPGLLFVVAAPSGAGKTSLCKALLAQIQAEGGRELSWSCSYTTRPPRVGEVPDHDYFFVDDQTFDRMVAADEFAEWAIVHGRRYGTSKSYLEEAADKGNDLLVEIDIQGAKKLKRMFNKACFIFILPPALDALEKRLRTRGTESVEEIKKRLSRAQEEILEWSGFDYIIINDDFEKAVGQLRAIILAYRSQREVMKPTVESILKGVK